MAAIRISALLDLPASLRASALKRAVYTPTLRASAPPCQRHISTTTRQHTAETPSPQSSVNETEVTHFTTLASSWWDPQGSSRLLHLMNPLRHNFIRSCHARESPEQNTKLKYLDIGCGGGIFAESAARLPATASVTAIDPTPSVIEVAKKHQRQDPLLLEPGRLNYLNASIEDLPVPTSAEEQYDVITVFEVLEHIRQPSPFLNTALSHLKPGGWLIGSTIARTGVSWFTTKFMAEEVLRMVPRGTHEWGQFIQPAELEGWAKGQGELDLGGGGWRVEGCVYVPGMGWKVVEGSEGWGNYFFGVRKKV